MFPILYEKPRRSVSRLCPGSDAPWCDHLPRDVPAPTASGGLAILWLSAEPDRQRKARSTSARFPPLRSRGGAGAVNGEVEILFGPSAASPSGAEKFGIAEVGRLPGMLPVITDGSEFGSKLGSRANPRFPARSATGTGRLSRRCNRQRVERCHLYIAFTCQKRIVDVMTKSRHLGV
jgi:hypothetical protein